MSMKKLFIRNTDLLIIYNKGGVLALRNYIKKYDTYISDGQSADLILSAVLENKSDIYIKECLLNNKKEY
jgi:hypothetical protein